MTSVISRMEEDTIRSLPTRGDRVIRFVDIVLMAGPTAFSCFLEALNIEKPHLANRVREEEGTYTISIDNIILIYNA
jgi:hypothetical protein